MKSNPERESYELERKFLEISQVHFYQPQFLQTALRANCSGDNILPGPRFYAAEQRPVRILTGSNEPGHADIALLNEMGVQSSALGNHEFDVGPGELADAIKAMVPIQLNSHI